MSRKISMSQAINEAMAMAMRKDENVILMGEDVAGGAEVDHLQDDEAWGGFRCHERIGSRIWPG